MHFMHGILLNTVIRGGIHYAYRRAHRYYDGLKIVLSRQLCGVHAVVFLYRSISNAKIQYT